MKERIKKIIIVLLIMAGIVLVGALMHEFLPIWARCTVWGIGLIWLLYDVSKPEKKPKETYWYYSYITAKDNTFSIGNGVHKSAINGFNFAYMQDIHKNDVIVMVQEIGKAQYDTLNEIINKEKEKSYE